MAEDIRKINGSYRARIQLDGKRRSATFPTRAKARSWIAEQRADHARGQWLDPREGNIPLDVYVEHWIAGRSHRWSGTTEDRYRRYLSHLPEPTVPLNRISAERIRAWQGQVASEVGVPTANKMVTVLHGVLKAAVAEKRIGTNEAAHVERIPHKAREADVLEADELRALLDHLDGEYRAAATFLAFTGMRAGDGLTVTAEHVDVLGKRVRVDNAKSKTAKAHWVPLMAPIVDDVLERARTAEGYLFSLTPGKPMDKCNFNKVLKQAAQDAGIDKNVHLHCLRHGLATWALQQGVPIHVVSRWLGHSSIDVTIKHYAHLLSDDFTDMAAAVEGQWAAGGGLRAVQ